MSLTAREKELTGVGISIAAGCKPCTDYHIRKACEAGVSDAEIGASIGRAITLRHAATGIMETHGLSRLNTASKKSGTGEARGLDRIGAIISLGAAFAVNCVSSYRKHLDSARGAGVSNEEIGEILELGEMVKDRASHHVRRAAGTGEAEESP